MVSASEFQRVLLGGRMNIILCNYDVNFPGHMEEKIVNNQDFEKQ